MKLKTIVAALAAALSLVLLFVLTGSSSATTLGPVTNRHFTANGNFSTGSYAPGAVGFNVADISSASALSGLPSGVQGLAWIGSCNGADAAFRSTVDSFKGHSGLFGFYIMDDADPTGNWGPLCTAASLRAEADYIHAATPGAKAFILPMNLSSSDSPSFDPSYSQANTHLDLYGLDPYPCRTETNTCTYSMINGYVGAAEKIGIPQAAIVPVYQTFGLGGWQDDGGGQYAVPTAAQLTQILNTWATLAPTPVFDYAYSWGVQNSDQALSGLPALQAVMKQHNGSTAPPPQPSSTSATATAPAPTPTHSVTPSPTHTRICGR